MSCGLPSAVYSNGYIQGCRPGYSALESGAPPPSTISGGVAAGARAARFIREAGLFSTNEEAADIATEHLPYLLVDHHTALLTLACGGVARARLSALAEAKLLLERFLGFVCTTGIMPPGEAAMLGVSTSGEEERREEEGAVKVDVALLRSQKIERYKRNRAAKAALAALAGRGVVGGTEEGRADGVGGKNSDGARGGMDAESVREGALLALQSSNT